MDIQFSTSPPPDWQAWCEASGDLFNSSAWNRVLNRGFRIRTLYVWCSDRQSSCSVTVFRAGPFALGYLGFPVGGGLGGGVVDRDLLEGLSSVSLPLRLHGLKVPGRDLIGISPVGAIRETVFETTIENLSDWDPARLPKVRRALARGRRSALQLRNAEPTEAGRLHQLYQHTVTRAGGAVRYTSKYFETLVALSTVHPGVLCRVAEHHGTIVGFMVSAWHGGAAYYLHGATHPDYQSYSPSDALFHEAIIRARDHGLQRFELLASPADQPGLIRYKEKWGGVTRSNELITLAVQPNWLRLFNLCRAAYGCLKRADAKLKGR